MAHFFRAALEGIAFSYAYGIEAMHTLGIEAKRIRVGNDNLFQSNTFSSTIANLLKCELEVVNTTGAVGAAKASGVAIGLFSSVEEAMEQVEIIRRFDPKPKS